MGKKNSSIFRFFDGCDHPEFQPGPHLHFRSTTMEDVTVHAEVLLEQILQEQTAIPTTRLLLFDASDSRLNGDDVRNKEAIGDSSAGVSE